MTLEAKALIHGVLASLLLTLVYFVLVGYVESSSHAVERFLSTSYLMLPLITGFGVQVGLYSYSQQYSYKAFQGGTGVTACGGLSLGSMISCCLHHLTDIAAVFAITTIGSVLVTFQPLFITIGLLSNVVGILTILRMIQKGHLYDTSGTLARIMHLNFGKARDYVALVSPIVVVSLAWFLFNSQGNMPSGGALLKLPPRTLEQNGLAMEVTPLPINLGKEVRFEISLDTHAGSLNFDLDRIASLEDDHGNAYGPAKWEGDPPSGHHRKGTLSFPPLSGRPHSVRLIMNGLKGTDWIFEWDLTG